MVRKQFTFYESFALATASIKNEKQRCRLYDAIVRYALYEEEPDKLPESVSVIFELIRPTLDSSRKKAAAGKKGMDQRWEKDTTIIPISPKRQEV